MKEFISAAQRSPRMLLAGASTLAQADPDLTNNASANLAAWCQRCHILHDRVEHLRRRHLTVLARRALGDLFGGAYPP